MLKLRKTDNNLNKSIINVVDQPKLIDLCPSVKMMNPDTMKITIEELYGSPHTKTISLLSSQFSNVNLTSLQLLSTINSEVTGSMIWCLAHTNLFFWLILTHPLKLVSFNTQRENTQILSLSKVIIGS